MTTSANVAPAAARHEPDVLEHLPRLRDHVALADELPVCIERHAAGDEEQVAGPHSVGVVGERLGQALDPVLLPVGHFETYAFSASRPGLNTWFA